MTVEAFAHSPDFAAIVLSLKVGATATVLSLPFGFAAAYIGTRLRPRTKAVFDTFVNLPLTLPPVVIGYLLRISGGRELSDLYAYRWGAGELLLAAKAEGDALFELSSRDIVLFRRNPEAISARNLLECRVTRLPDWGKRAGVELAYGGETLVAEVMRESVAELSIAPGITVYAAVKASAFRPLR